jgi:sugar O-acyltransferase (sialic acid O-acetyltransferase NeuD family)
MPLARTQLESLGLPPERLVFVDDAPTAAVINGHDVVTYSEFLALRATARFAALAIADGSVRRELAERCTADDVQPWAVTATNAVLMDDVSIDVGAILSPFVTVTSNVRIGRYFHGNLYSYVEHDCIIGDFVTFAPGAKCNGNVVVEDHAYVGSGAVIKQGRPGDPLVIGRGAVVGMGAIVTKSVRPGDTVVGNPARPMNRTQLRRDA